MPEHTIAIVDGNSLIHRAFHALPETMTAPDGRPTNAAFGFLSMLIKLITDIRPDGVIVAFDRGRPAFRTRALEQYKVHRPPTPEALKAQFPMVKALLEALEVPIVEVEGWEGDDVLGTLAARAEQQGLEVVLVTGDRDAFQLVSDRVRVATTRKGLTDIVLMGPQEVRERYGVAPEQIPDFLGLKGDASDNIPGVPGIGEKTAARLLQQYGTLEAVLEAAGQGRIPGKVGESLLANAEAARASRTVATIAREVPIAIDPASVTFGSFDPRKAAAALGELRFTSLVDRVLALAPRVSASAPGAGRAGSTDAEAAAPGKAPALPPVVEGQEALAAIRRWIDEPPVAWIGVAVDEPADALFSDGLALAAAGPDATAIVRGEAASGALGMLCRGGRFASADLKALLHELCPADETRPCDDAALVADTRRLFDVGIAAYLLESNRSSFDVAGLSADYLGRPIVGGAGVEELARCTADLACELEKRLEADGSIDVFRRIEMPLVPVLVRMERVGVGLDTSVLARLIEETREQIESLRGEIFELAGCEFTIDSPKQLAEVLFDKLGLPPQKRTKTGYSTDAGVLAALAPLHPIAEKIVAYRELTKLTSTYLEALPRMVGPDGRLHTTFNQTVAATGRLSSSSPNLQNIPVRTELGRKIRAAFVPARDGDLIVTADYSQIELRILAHLSGDEGLIEAFLSGADFHAATASRIFGVPIDKVEPAMRSRAKAVNFGIVYGQTAHGLAETLKISNAEAQAMIDRYYAAYPGVRAYLDAAVAAAHRDGFAATMFGRKRRIPELKSSNYSVRSFGERTAMNHPMQGSAADIMKLAMIEVDRRLREEGYQSRMVLQVHDELVFEAPAHEVERLSAMVKDAMTGVVSLKVPLEVSVGVGTDWASAK